LFVIKKKGKRFPEYLLNIKYLFNFSEKREEIFISGITDRIIKI